LIGRRRVVVIGAGFAGLECTKVLAGTEVDVTIVDRNNFHTFSALLYQVATAELAPGDVGFPVRGLFHRAPNVGVRRGTVRGVDWDGRRVLFDDGEDLPFDVLVVAAGATTNWFGVEGAAEHAFPLYGMGDAMHLRNRILSAFEAADADPASVGDGHLTMTVVGGGPTGVEMAGALVELFAVEEKDFPDLDVSAARVVLLEARDSLLGSFSGKARQHALDELRARGVDVRLDTAVARVDHDGVTLRSGECIPSRTVIWCAGTEASPLATTLGLPTGKGGRVEVGPDLRVPGWPDVFAVGDLAAIADGGDGFLPQLAPVAQQAGRFAGREILRSLRGEAPRRFHYRDLGTMATIGRRAAAADLRFGIRLTGTLGWLAWLVLHLWRILGVRNRAAVLLTWAWNYVTWDRGNRLIVAATDPRPSTD
jgi:NADH dehydrogenase